MTALRPWLFVFAVAFMLGFVVIALGSGIIDEKAIFGTRESADARRYMISLLENEPHTLIALTPRTGVVHRAMQFAQAEGAQGQISVTSLTYLGGRNAGALSVHSYALEMRTSDGQRQFFPLALTLVEGKVIRRE
ncbi:MAG: hypothetical protein ACRDGT_10510 [Candidatus Limnocylindria bacterium]